MQESNLCFYFQIQNLALEQIFGICQCNFIDWSLFYISINPHEYVFLGLHFPHLQRNRSIQAKIFLYIQTQLTAYRTSFIRVKMFQFWFTGCGCLNVQNKIKLENLPRVNNRWLDMQLTKDLKLVAGLGESFSYLHWGFLFQFELKILR